MQSASWLLPGCRPSNKDDRVPIAYVSDVDVERMFLILKQNNSLFFVPRKETSINSSRWFRFSRLLYYFLIIKLVSRFALRNHSL